MATITGRFCRNCGSEGVQAYCAACGEAWIDRQDLRFSAFARGAARDLFQLDGRLLRTLRVLFTQPGELTNAYVEGRRSSFLSPLQLYLLISLLFFLLAPRLGYFQYNLGMYERNSMFGDLPARLVAERLAETREPRESFQRRFNERINEQKRVMAVVLVPGLAIMVAGIYSKRRRFFAEHLVFCTHFFCVFWLYLMVLVPLLMSLFILLVTPIARMFPTFGNFVNAMLNGEVVLVLLILLPTVAYMARAVRRFYGDALWPSRLRALLMMVWVVVMIVVCFKEPLFFSTFYTL